MKKNTQWMLLVTACVTFMLACFCADGQRAVEMEDYEVEIRQEDGGNTDRGYYVVLPKPKLPLVIGSHQPFDVNNWEDDGLVGAFDLEVGIDTNLGGTSNNWGGDGYFEPKVEGVFTVNISGLAYINHVDRRDELVEDTFSVRAVQPKRVVIDGLCASKVLAKNTSQFVSVRFAYDDQAEALAYGKGYYPFGFDPAEVSIVTDKKAHAHTIRTMHLTVSDAVGPTVTLTDKLDNARPIVFNITEAKTIERGQLVPMEEYASKTNNPSHQRLILQATLDDGSQVCPEDYQVKTLTPQICKVVSEYDLLRDPSKGDTDPERFVEANRRWFVVGLVEGVCQLEAIISGFEGVVTQELMIDKRAERTIEVRQREKPTQSTGGGGSSDYDFD